MQASGSCSQLQCSSYSDLTSIGNHQTTNSPKQTRHGTLTHKSGSLLGKSLKTSKQTSSFEINKVGTGSSSSSGGGHNDITSKFRLKKSSKTNQSNMPLPSPPQPHPPTSSIDPALEATKNFSIERRHAISSLDVSVQKSNKTVLGTTTVETKQSAKKSKSGKKIMMLEDVMKKSSLSSSDKSKTASSSSDRIDEETNNNFYEQRSISSSLSSTNSSSNNNFPTIQIDEEVVGAAVRVIDHDGRIENDGESSPENIDYGDDDEYDDDDDGGTNIELSCDTSVSHLNRYRVNASPNTRNDPFLRDLTACLQMKQKKVNLYITNGKTYIFDNTRNYRMKFYKIGLFVYFCHVLEFFVLYLRS